MPTLRNRIIRLAASNEELRPLLLPLLKKQAGGLPWDRRLLAKAAKDVQTELRALEAVQDAYEAWKSTHRETAESMSAIREDMARKGVESDDWRNEVTSAFSTATWYGLDVRDFVKHMAEAEKALGGTYGSLDDAQRILDDIKRIS